MENQNLSILLQWKIKTWTTYAPAMCNVIWIVTQTLGLTPCTRIHDNGWIWALYQNTHCCLSWIGFICLRCMSSSFKIVSKPMIFFHVSLSIFVSKVEFPNIFIIKVRQICLSDVINSQLYGLISQERVILREYNCLQWT